MRLRSLCVRSILFFWRTNLAVVLGAAVGAAALTGALIVGDSMRASLQEVAVGRLGRVDHALVAPRFFREALADDIAKSPAFTEHFDHVCPIILLNGGATHAERRTRVDRVSLYGIDQRFWELAKERDLAPSLFKEGGASGGRSVILNQALADELNAQVGDEVLLRTGKPNPIASETLLGRRDDTVSTLRVTVAEIIPAEGLGAFSLNPRQSTPKNAYVPLPTLQRALQQPDRVNAFLVAAKKNSDSSIAFQSDRLIELMRPHVTLGDLGLKLRVDEPHSYLSLESEAILVPPPVEAAALAAAHTGGLDPSPILTHLANSITSWISGGEFVRPDNGKAIPYSPIAAVDSDSPTFRSLAELAGINPAAFQEYVFNSISCEFPAGDVLLNEWAANDLGVQPGDTIELAYYPSDSGGSFSVGVFLHLRGIVPMVGIAADPGFVPQYKGITDTQDLADWDPPFPIDLRLIRDKDEDYWDQHRTTPKAFITLADGQRLWADQSERFGRLTSIRLTPAQGKPLDASADEFSRELLREVSLGGMGFQWDPVRERVAQAGRGNTDFGMLFIGFSSFLILSAMMLVALLFRLGIERRAHEIGLLLGTGFSPRTISRLLMIEGAALAVVGAAIGLLGANAYAWLMLAGLRSWWSEAVHAPFLQLHGSPSTYAIGFAVSLMIASASAAWSIRGLTRRSPRSLLATATAGEVATHGRGRRLTTIIALTAFAAAIVLAAISSLTEVLPKALAFFLAGASMLCACLAALSRRLRSEARGTIHTPGAWTLVRLGLRNAPRNLGRSTLTAGLIASATFVILSLEAFRLDADAETGDRQSGTGGFALYAESAAPLPYDLATAEGREALNLGEPVLDATSGVSIMPFRLRTGDESSCLNLYRATKPRILGVTEAMIRRGGFRFASTLAATDAERENPWALLNRTFPDGAIAAIGDEAAVRWQLHLNVGQDLIVEDEAGREKHLRFVALLKGSALQSELLVAESEFVKLFPAVSGQGFFLIEAPKDRITDVERALESGLERFSFDAAPTSRRLAEFLAVQNTYISTFQTLGGIGLLLGTAGLAVVMLRNVWERRGELALLRTLGFSRPTIASIVLSENAALLIFGLLSGGVAALVAVVPVLAEDPSAVPWSSLSLTFGAVLLAGAISSGLALVPTLRGPLLATLRAE